MDSIIKKSIIICLLGLSYNVNSSEDKDKAQYGNYNQNTFENSILYSKPIYSPIDLRYVKKDLDKCSNIGFRLHPIFKVMKEHNGIDLPAETGTPVISTLYGIVKFYGVKADGYGNQIILESQNYTVRYAHLSRIDVSHLKFNSNGELMVKYGDVIGYVGSTGQSTGSHLHYEIFKDNVIINPLPSIRGEN